MNNLVGNAIDAEKNAVCKDIIIRVLQTGGCLQIEVKDFGCGVSPQIKNRLFKQMITSKGAAGTGLGVYISNAVIRGKFGGDMGMRDNSEDGSTFWISIPMSKVVLKDKSMQREQSDEKK